MGVYIDNSSASAPRYVSISRVAAIGNDENGIAVYSNGNIIASNLTVVDHQHGDGAVLETYGTNAAITLTGNNQFKWNDGNGLSAWSEGTIRLYNVLAMENNGNGVEATSANGALYMYTSTLQNNGWSGADLEAETIVYLYQVRAFSNGWDGQPSNEGIYIKNGATTTKVYILYSSIMANWGNGIEILMAPGTPAPFIPLLTGTSYFGNGGQNLYYHF